MDGVDTVVHLAGAASPESTWDDVLGANVVGTRNVLEAARDAGVRRVVYASSNHVLGMYDRDEQWPVGPTDLPRPDSLYGVTKVFGETLGRYYHDAHGLSVLCLRIGWVSPDPTETDVELLRAMWLSEDDAERVFAARSRSRTSATASTTRSRTTQTVAGTSRARCSSWATAPRTAGPTTCPRASRSSPAAPAPRRLAEGS